MAYRGSFCRDHPACTCSAKSHGHKFPGKPGLMAEKNIYICTYLLLFNYLNMYNFSQNTVYKRKWETICKLTNVTNEGLTSARLTQMSTEILRFRWGHIERILRDFQKCRSFFGNRLLHMSPSHLLGKGLVATRACRHHRSSTGPVQWLAHIKICIYKYIPIIQYIYSM